jgi:hypothetical protein
MISPIFFYLSAPALPWFHPLYCSCERGANGSSMALGSAQCQAQYRSSRCPSMNRAAVADGEQGRAKPRAQERRFGLLVEPSSFGETRLWWREQRPGDGGGAAFAPRRPARGLRRWSGVEPASEQRTRRPAGPMYTPCKAPLHRRMLYACAPSIVGSIRQKRSMRRSIPPI